MPRTYIRFQASAPQTAFINAPERFPLLVAGFGSGKTEALIQRSLRLKWAYPEQNIAYYLPTYDLVTQIGYPRFESVLQRARIKYALNRQEHVIRIEKKGKIIFRTLDTPERIVGYEVADSLVDELDTLRTEHAAYAWRQIVARNRQKKPDGSPNTAGVGTTPEGFRFVYERWEKNPVEGCRLIRASTYSNLRNLPPDYIDNLKAMYPAHLLDAYLNGLFVNLTIGAVYPDFDRALNHTDENIEPWEPLHVGVDFNVGNCTAIVCAIRGGRPVALMEHTGIRDTPALAALLRDAYADQGHEVMVYPDASGKSRKTVNASLSDLQILREHGLFVVVDESNPAVRDRLAAVNGQILNGFGQRRLRVNTRNCPTLTECLEQQVYRNGEPDKTSGKDHAPDALGYFIEKRFSVTRPKGFLDILAAESQARHPPCEPI